MSKMITTMQEIFWKRSQQIFKDVFKGLFRVLSKNPVRNVSFQKPISVQAIQTQKLEKHNRKMQLQQKFEDEQMELSLALAGFLVAMSTILLTSISSPESSLDDQMMTGNWVISMGPIMGVFSVATIVPILGVFSIYGAARIIDYWLDELDKTFWDRLSMFGGGYTIFCLIVSFMTVGLWFLAAQQQDK